MMNKSGIEYCDFTWNPITGCRTGCPYCYAARQARRFCGDIRLNKSSGQLKQTDEGLWELEKPFHGASGRVLPLPVGFEPTMHRYRLDMPHQKKKPAILFVGAMADIFGEWVPDEWLFDVFTACEAAPQHQYLFLTKNPQRYNDLLGAGMLPTADNFWYGGTRTGKDTDREHESSMSGHTFLSIEPIHTQMEDAALHAFELWDWIIIGAETGNRKGKIVPQREWIIEIVDYCQREDVPVFMKNSPIPIVGKENMLQQWPPGMKKEYKPPLPKTRLHISSVRDHKQCVECGKDLKGMPAMRLASRYNMCMDCYAIRTSDEK